MKSGDGAAPSASLIYLGGKLYGTTKGGGGDGFGTVFSVTPAGVEKVVYSFGAKSGDGAAPSGLIDLSGKLYGTTYEGGDANLGTVFSVTPAGVEKVLCSFGMETGAGAYPFAGLIYLRGKLYGTTGEGGKDGFGSVFSVTPAGVEKVVYSFGVAELSDGVAPVAGLIYLGGKLYGTTASGGGFHGEIGTVFSVTPAGVEKVVYSFRAKSGDGAAPYAGLIYLGASSTERLLRAATTVLARCSR